MDVLYGLHPVEEAIRAGVRQIDHISVAREREARRDPRFEVVLELCRQANIRVTAEPRDQLTRHVKTDTHQGIVAFLRERKFLALEDLLNAPPRYGSTHFFLALDGVEDPHNLGALLRSADGAGIDGVIVPERRSAPLSGVVAKTSAGASEHARIAQVVNGVARRRGRLFRDRHHRHELRTPTETRRALVYILFNTRKHAASYRWMDLHSSMRWFHGWAPERAPEAAQLLPPTPAAPVSEPRTWLASVGWRRAAGGLIRFDELPNR